MNFKIGIIAFVLFQFSLGYSQDSFFKSKRYLSEDSIISSGNLPIRLLHSKTRVINYENMKSEGSPYINNYSGLKRNLPVGKLFNKNRQHIGSAFIIYNAYTDYMEISAFEDGIDYYQLKALPNYLYIIFRQKKYRAYSFKGKLGYYAIISDNDTNPTTLLKKEKVIFSEGYTSSGNSYVTDTPPSFTRLKDIYFIKIDNQLFEVSKNKKSFARIFNERSEEVLSFIKSKDLKVTDENDLLTICNYYNSLIIN